MKSIILLFILFISATLHADRIETGVGSSILNYSNPDSVSLMKKLEIGITLPEEIQKSIDRFVSGAAGNKINPYLEWEIRVYAEIEHVGSGQSYVVDGFYFMDYNIVQKSQLDEPKNLIGFTEDEYRKQGMHRKIPNQDKFLVRFCPEHTGEWRYRIIVEIALEKFYSDTEWFTVLTNSYTPYLRVGKNGRYFEQEGDSYLPVGCNIPWPATNQSDEEMWTKMHHRNHKGNIGFLHEGYRANYLIPRIYENYRSDFSRLADHGVNLFRTIMYPTGTEIEWEKLGDYSDRLHMAWELDKTLELAEQKNVYLLWNLQIHYTYQFNQFAYHLRWCWNTPMNGDSLCYKKLIGSNNPLDFFTNEEAKKYYKQRLRYIISRYGYSPNIAVFELFSEISNVGSNKSDNSDHYLDGENWKIYYEWQTEMGKYIKSLQNGKNHLLTCSFAGEKSSKDPVYEESCFDIMSSNIYDFGEPGMGAWWVDHMSKNYVNEGPDARNSYTLPMGDTNRRCIKPVIFSETDPVIVEATCDSLTPEFERFFWQSLFSGNACAVSWMLWGEREYPAMYTEAKDFFKNVNLDADNWHPGASELLSDKNNSWVFNQDYTNFMIGDIRKGFVKRQRNADLQYLRSGSKIEAVGVVSNRTYNVYTADSCYDRIWDEYSSPSMDDANRWQVEPLREMRNVNLKGEKLKVCGLKKRNYIIRYYYSNDLKNPVGEEVFKGSKYRLKYESLPADEDHFLLLFRISPYSKPGKHKKPSFR